MTVEVPAIWAACSLALSLLIVATYFAIFWMMMYAIFWGIVKFFQVVLGIINTPFHD